MQRLNYAEFCALYVTVKHIIMAKSIIAYKLFRVRKDGSFGSLFIGKKSVIPLGKWLPCEDLKTPGYQHRPGWHAAPAPFAPHLTTKGRVWCEVQLRYVRMIERPKAQGSAWYLARMMRVTRQLTPAQVQAINDNGLP